MRERRVALYQRRLLLRDDLPRSTIQGFPYAHHVSRVGPREPPQQRTDVVVREHHSELLGQEVDEEHALECRAVLVSER